MTQPFTANLEAERNLLAIALNDGDEAVKIACLLTEDDLAEASARWLHLEMCRAIGKGRTPTVWDLLPLANEAQADYLRSVHERYVSSAGTDDLLAMLRAATQSRKATLAVKRALEALSEDGSAGPAIVNGLLDELGAIAAPSSAVKILSAGEIFLAAHNRIRQMQRHEIRSALPIGMPKAERVLAIQPGQLVLIGGRTKHGKTALALSWMWHSAFVFKVPVLYLNSEMSGAEIGIRLFSIGGGFNHTRLRLGNVTDDDLAAIKVFYQQRTDAGYFCSEALGHLTSAEVVGLARFHQARQKAEVLVVDYVQRLGDWENRRDRAQWQVFMEITQRLKTLATDLGLIVICLAQLNSVGELAASKGMANDADLTLSLERCHFESDADREGPEASVAGQTHLLSVRGARHIPGDATFALRMEPTTLQFTEVS